MKQKHPFQKLEKTFEGELFLDETARLVYATDASSYRQIPQA